MLELLTEEQTAASNSGRCCIDTLPEDIWMEIIRIYALNGYSGFQCISADLLLHVMLVSTSWWRGIQDTPRLWTDIVLSDKTEELGLKVALGLHYSNAAPLSLFLISGGTWLAVRSRAPSMQPRICSLLLSWGFPQEEVEFVMNDLCPLPSLTRMIAPEYRHIKKAFFHQHPFITDLDGLGVAITDLCTYQPRLTKLRWSPIPDISMMFQFLGRMECLKEVNLVSDDPFEEVGEFPPDFGSPTWTHLRCGLYKHRFYSVLLNQTRNTLVHLSLSASILSLVNHLSLALPELGQLESFYVTLVDTHDDKHIPIRPPPKQQICSVHKMRISFLLREEPSSDVLIIVGRVFRHMMKYVKTMSVFTDRLQHISFLFAETGFPLLKFINFYHFNALSSDGAQSEQVRLPSSLGCLDLSGNQALLDMCGSTTVAHLRLDGRELTLKTSQLSKWSNLHTLDLIGVDSSFDHFNSPTLKVLSIHDPINTCTVTALCRQLAISSGRCPRLERLEFSECPEWDIFMIMLERRNCKHDPEVVPIKYIVLPARIPRIICEAVRERLQGRRSPRLSNYELSLQGNLDILCDSDLPGCLKCHLALRSCREPITSSAPTVPDVISPYPDNDDDLLSIWERRYEQLAVHSIRTPSHFCRFNDYPPIHISEHSLEDPTFQLSPTPATKAKMKTPFRYNPFHGPSGPSGEFSTHVPFEYPKIPS